MDGRRLSRDVAVSSPVRWRAFRLCVGPHTYRSIVRLRWLSPRTGVAAVLVSVPIVATSLDLSGGWKALSIGSVVAAACAGVALEQHQQRLQEDAEAARSRLDIEVALVPATVCRVADVEAFVKSWEADERRACLRSVQPKPKPGANAGLSALGGQVDGMQALIASMDAQSKALSGVFDATSLPEDRTEEQYRSEVERYLERLAKRMREQVLREEVRTALSTVRVEIRNATDRNYVAVEVEAYIPGDVHGVDPRRVSRAAGPPSRPRAFGTGRPHKAFDYGYGLALPSHPVIPGPVIQRPSIDNGGSVRITYPAFDLRPRETVTLDPIHLITSAASGEVLRGTWTATATNADGQALGDLAVTVRDSTLDAEAVMTTWLAGDAANE
jgi:hypothetical protein